MMKKKYIFVLCPPKQGSTVLYRLLNTSPHISTFLGTHLWAGEGHGWIQQTDKNYRKNRWNPTYTLNMPQLHELYHRHWNTEKNILCDKSPPTICRAATFYDWFSQYGDVYFVIMIRDPYTTNYHPWEVYLESIRQTHITWWDELARHQQKNIEMFKDNSVFLTYEELCNNTEVIIDRLLKKMPFLGSLNNFGFSGRTEIHYQQKKTRFFLNNHEMINFFNYKIRKK